MSEDFKITLYDADLYDKVEHKEKSVQFVIFRISSEWYGVEITKIKEVTNVGVITFIPSVPAHIAGIVHLRGNILSVTDLKAVFGLPEEEFNEKSRMIVIFSGALETCLLVNEVAEPVEVAVSKIDPALTTIDPDRAGYIEGEIKIGKKLIGILKVEKILENKK